LGNKTEASAQAPGRGRRSIYPVLFRIGQVTVYTYGIVVAVALLLAALVAGRLVRSHGLPRSFTAELALAGIVGGFLGARAYWIVQHWGATQHDLVHYLLSGSGFTWYGGLAGGLIFVVVLSLVRKVPLGLMANIIAPATALGYGVGRIACQLAGDGNYGRPSDLPWAMAYPNGMVPTTVPVQPTPVYETLAMLLIFWFLCRLARREQPHWYVFAWFLLLSGAERLLIEFLRLNPPFALGLTAPQWIALAGMTIGITLIARQRGKAVGAVLARASQ
jgi:phosphatidylglycerol:prolipoprotein diacylglycerol transferase